MRSRELDDAAAPAAAPFLELELLVEAAAPAANASASFDFEPGPGALARSRAFLLLRAFVLGVARAAFSRDCCPGPTTEVAVTIGFGRFLIQAPNFGAMSVEHEAVDDFEISRDAGNFAPPKKKETHNTRFQLGGSDQMI